MSAIHLDKIFHPKSIAVIGDDSPEGRLFSTLVHNLMRGGYSGGVYPIHQCHKRIWEQPVYPSLLQLNPQVDLAVYVGSVNSASRVIEECIGAKVKLRIIGPDCLGIICSGSKLNLSFSSHTPLPGKMAFVSQSGAICVSVLDLCLREHVGYSYFVSLGSMMDVDFGDIIDYLGGDYDVGSIVIFIESIPRIRNFMSAARSVSRIKPIIALKAGRTEAGALAIASHTGRLGGEDAVYDAAFERAGIVRINTFEELFDCVELLAKQPRPLKPGLAIVTNAGSPGVMAVDALADHGIDPAVITHETIVKLDEFLPLGWSRTNPVDILGDASPERYEKTVNICLKDPAVNGLLIILAPQALTRPTEVAESLVGVIKRTSYPIFVSWIGGKQMEMGRDIFNRKGIPTFDTPERAVRAFMDLFRYSKNLEMLQEIPPKFDRKIEFDVKSAQIQIQKALSKKEFCLISQEANDLLKAYGIPVYSSETVFSGQEIEQYYELAIGSKKDQDFGPVIYFGLGGILADVMKDRSVALPPLNRLLAREVMKKTKLYTLLKGFKNYPPCNLTLLEEILIRLAQMVTDFPEIEEIDINPLIVTENDMRVKNGRIVLSSSTIQAPHHLVISPYPNQYEARTIREGVGELFIRPIRPEDASLLVQLFDALSRESVYFRFFSSLKMLPPSMLARFTQIDYDREIALVALWGTEPNEKMLGVARVITDIYNRKNAEFSIVVGDPWQGKGIGAELLKRCLLIAKERGIENVHGIVLPENTQMLALGKKLGFTVKKIVGESEYELNIDLTKL
ncbi:MAG: GNAT family N-acetyltransferase [Desulfobacterales bacterium]